MKHNIILNMGGHVKSDNNATAAEAAYDVLRETSDVLARVYKYDIDIMKQLLKLKKIILFIKISPKKDLRQFALKINEARELSTLALLLPMYGPGVENEYKKFLSKYQYIWHVYNKKIKNHDKQISQLNNQFLNPSWMEIFEQLPELSADDLIDISDNIEMLFQTFEHPLYSNLLAVHTFGAISVYDEVFKENNIYLKTALRYESIVTENMKTYKFAHEIYRKMMNRYFLDESLRYLLSPKDILKQFDKLCKSYSGPVEFRNSQFQKHFKEFAMPIYKWIIDIDIDS